MALVMCHSEHISLELFHLTNFFILKNKNKNTILSVVEQLCMELTKTRTKTLLFIRLKMCLNLE